MLFEYLNGTPWLIQYKYNENLIATVYRNYCYKYQQLYFPNINYKLNAKYIKKNGEFKVKNSKSFLAASKLQREIYKKRKHAVLFCYFHRPTVPHGDLSDAGKAEAMGTLILLCRDWNAILENCFTDGRILHL